MSRLFDEGSCFCWPRVFPQMMYLPYQTPRQNRWGDPLKCKTCVFLEATMMLIFKLFFYNWTCWYFNRPQGEFSHLIAWKNLQFKIWDALRNPKHCKVLMNYNWNYNTTHSMHPVQFTSLFYHLPKRQIINRDGLSD